MTLPMALKFADERGKSCIWRRSVPGITRGIHTDYWSLADVLATDWTTAVQG